MQIDRAGPDGGGMVRIVLTLMAILALALVAQAEEHQPPAYDLNGRWEVTDVLCHDRSGRNEMTEQGFYTRRYGGELRTVKQVGNDLEIVFLDLLRWYSESGERLDATLSSDRIRYEGYSDEVSDDGQMSLSFKGKGRVLSADRIIERLTYTATDLTGGNSGYFYTCELEVERVFVGTGLLELDEDEAEVVEEPQRDAGNTGEVDADNLTGRWVTTAIDCDSFSSDLPELALAELDGQIEYETLQSPGVRIVQMGNDLEFTDLETGGQWAGTISGDQVRYAESYQSQVFGLNSDAYLEAEGTVLDADHIAVTYDLNATIKIEGTTITIGTLCTGRLQRTEPAEQES